MSFDKFCPGSSKIRNPVPEYLSCTNCGGEVEMWSDETKARCTDCGTTVYRDVLPSCVDWCKHAADCVGADVLARLRPAAK